MKDLYQFVTDSVVSLLESDLPPWRKPWNDDTSIDSALPFNAISGRHYSGINTVLLWAEAHEQGYSRNGWLTFRQASENGGHVRKGERGRTVVFWKFQQVTDDDGQTKNVPFARAFTVFNVNQCEGLQDTKAGQIPQPVEPDNVISWAQSVGAEIRHGGNRACFVPSADLIQLPRPEQFPLRAEYHATALHELTHWTGHKSRLARTFGKRFGDEAYAFEELCAELGSAFLCASIGVENAELSQHASYLDHWLKILKSDKRAIFTAAKHAQAACNYCLEHGKAAELAA